VPKISYRLIRSIGSFLVILSLVSLSHVPHNPSKTYALILEVQPNSYGVNKLHKSRVPKTGDLFPQPLNGCQTFPFFSLI